MPKVYNAPKPQYSNWEWFKFIAIRTVFPPVLLWDLITFGANKLLGEWVGSMVLPAQHIDFSCLAISDDTVSQYNEGNLVCNKHTIITHDGAHLDTFEVNYRSPKPIAPNNQKYIINLVGNGASYEGIINEMKRDAKMLQAHVVGFNLRGVGQSTSKAKSKDDLVTDGIAQVQRLLDQGISPQNITLKGHSLGASIATLVTQHFHQLGKPINLFNSRSFSNITNILVGHMRLERDASDNAIGHKESSKGTIIGWLIKPLIQLAVTLAQWEIDAGSAFASIPDASKEYIVVRSRKTIRDNRIDDPVIPHYASIHEALTSERRKKKAEIDKQIAQINHKIQNALPLEKQSLTQQKESLTQARKKISSDRKMEALYPMVDGHNAHWHSLHNRWGKSAHTFFTEFVQRTGPEQAVLPKIMSL